MNSMHIDLAIILIYHIDCNNERPAPNAFMPQCIAGLSLWVALLYPLEVSIQKLAQGCPVPPSQQPQPKKECPRRQYDNANDVSVEQDNSGEDNGGCGSQKSNYGKASQEESPQCFINPSH